MKKKFVSSAILAAALAVTSVVPAFAEGDTSEVYWYSDVAGYGPANWNTDSSPALDYVRDNIGLTFNLEQPPTDAATKLGLMLATNDLPDIISITNSDSMKDLIKAGAVWDMQEFLEKYDPDSWLLEGYPEDHKQALIDRFGGWYSLASHIETADNRKVFPPDDECWVDVVEKGTNSCIMFDKSIMDALGITEEMVSTEEGFYEACELVKNSGYTTENGESVIPVALHADGWIDTSLDGILSWNFGAVPVDEEGNYRHKELSPGYKNALKFINNCIQKEYLDVNILTLDEAALKTYLEAGRVFCWIGNQAQINKENTSWVSYGAITPENEAKGALPINQSAGTGWIQTFVSKSCDEPEKVAEFLSWITSEEGLMMDYYGIEGEYYTVDDKGIVTKTEKGEQELKDLYENNILFWPFASTSFERHTEPVPDPTSNRGVEIALMPAFGKEETTYIYDSSLIDFPDTVLEPSSDLGIKLSQVKSYLESQKAKIVTAKTDEEFETEYNNMVSTLEDYSIADIDAAYDEVYKKNCENTGNKIEDINADLYK